jgi:hypothetical protein
MKKLFFLLIFSSFITTIKCQSLNLQALIGDVYRKTDIGLFSKEQLCYIIPEDVKFIDTTAKDPSIRPRLLYFQNESNFADYLKKAGQTFFLIVHFDKLTYGNTEITMEVSRITAESYFGSNRLFTPVSRERIALFYSKRLKAWKFASVIRRY